MIDDRRRYRKIYIRLWKNPAFRRFVADDKVMTLYLLSGPQTNRIGLYHISMALASEDLGAKVSVLRKRVDHVCQTFGWQTDWIANVIWIPSWWDFNQPSKNENNMVGALSDVHEVPASPLIEAFARHLCYVPETLRGLFGPISDRYARTPSEHCSITDRTQEQEQEQEQEMEQEVCAASSAAPAVLTFPTVGPVATWALTEAQLAKWQGYYPALDVLGECRKALGWCDANPRKRKTVTGMPAFLNRWLAKTVDDGRTTTPAPKGLVVGSLKTAGNLAGLAEFAKRGME